MRSPCTLLERAGGVVILDVTGLSAMDADAALLTSEIGAGVT